MRSCNHIKSDGRPCNAPALRKHSYCFFHQQQLNRRRRDYVDRLPILEDRAAVQVGIMQVLDRLYNKTIDYKAAALMLYGLQLASTNLKHDVFGRLNGEKVDRYYGNANETEAPVTSMGAPSKPAVGLGGSVVGAPYLPDVGRCGSVPEARDEGSPARSAGFQADKTIQVPEGRPNTPLAFLGGQPYQLDPERAAELERLFSETIPEINACTDDTAENGSKEKLDAPPLSRSDRVGITIPNSQLPGAPGSRRRCANLGEKNSPHHGARPPLEDWTGRARLQPCQKPRPKVASSLPQSPGAPGSRRISALTWEEGTLCATVEGHGFSRAKKPRPKVASSHDSLTTCDYHTSHFCLPRP
jgi:hypothetical protein